MPLISEACTSEHGTDAGPQLGRTHLNLAFLPENLLHLVRAQQGHSPLHALLQRLWLAWPIPGSTQVSHWGLGSSSISGPAEWDGRYTEFSGSFIERQCAGVPLRRYVAWQSATVTGKERQKVDRRLSEAQWDAAALA